MIRNLSFDKARFAKSGGLLADIALMLGVIALLYILAKVGAGMMVAFRPPSILPSIDLDPKNLPYYAARSTLRMFIALGFSVVFTLVYGYIAAKSKRAERVMIPLLDILQSVPVLGFLSVTVTGFIALFPGSLLGLECASLFAIFTGQVWNMTFAFYHSVITIPKELDEAARMFRMTKMQRFWKLEVPSSMIPLVWNGMMSFGGGWFFVSASEAISVLNKKYTLPGLGAYVASAIEAKDLRAIAWAVVTMTLIIIIVDQFFWKPLVAWAEKYKLERSASQSVPTSWVYDLLKASRIPKQVSRSLRRFRRKVVALFPKKATQPHTTVEFKKPKNEKLTDTVYGIVLGVVLCSSAYFAAKFILGEVKSNEVLTCIGLGILTMLRVTVLVILGTVVWVPIGVAIGFSPKLGRIFQPVVQFLASFPANFLFPVATIFFLKTGITLNWGSMLLMSLGAQWYILFNAIAGAMAVPTDLREMSKNMRMGRRSMWQKVIIPAIFPAWVTGGITASGGAWNASIVSEIVTWGDKTLTASGLGAYISKATEVGDWPRIVLGVSLMCIFVVSINRLFWRRLYVLAQSRYKLG